MSQGYIKKEDLAMAGLTLKLETVTLKGTKIEKLTRQNGLTWIDNATALLNELEI